MNIYKKREYMGNGNDDKIRVVKTSTFIGGSAERSTWCPYCWRHKKHFSTFFHTVY